MIYVAYGSIHSRLMSTDMKKHSPEHLAYTARVGAILLLIGDGLLFLTRSFDLFKPAYAKLTSLSGWDRFTAALQQTFQAESWTKASLFLVIPLVINTLVLCSLIIRRAARAGGLSRKDKEARMAANTAIVVAILSLIYLAIVIF